MSTPDLHSPVRPQSAFLANIRQPIFAEILRHRPICIFLALLATAQLATAFLRVTIIFCPFAAITGLPCPGCGLTRATAYLATGHFRQSLTQHAFAPLVLLGLLALAFASVAPAPLRNRFAAIVETLERRTGITVLLFAFCILYWIARLIIVPHAALVPYQP